MKIMSTYYVDIIRHKLGGISHQNLVQIQKKSRESRSDHRKHYIIFLGVLNISNTHLNLALFRTIQLTYVAQPFGRSTWSRPPFGRSGRPALADSVSGSDPPFESLQRGTRVRPAHGRARRRRNLGSLGLHHTVFTMLSPSHY
jgi:hypothetical protein